MLDNIERLLGRLFASIRAGENHLAWNDPRLSGGHASIKLKSSAFEDGQHMPVLYSAGGGGHEDLSPPLNWTEVPGEAKELVLILQDPDAPLRRPVVHLIVAAIPPQQKQFTPGQLTSSNNSELTFGRGWLGKKGYSGPRPVRCHGPHRYVFQIFAVRKKLELGLSPTYEEVVSQMKGSVLAKGRLTGLFERT